MKQQGFIPLLIVLLVTVLGTTGYLVYGQVSKNSNNSSVSIPSQKVSDDVTLARSQGGNRPNPSLTPKPTGKVDNNQNNSQNSAKNNVTDTQTPTPGSVSTTPSSTPIPATVKLPNNPYDLDVAYIERTPKYPRYCLYDNNGVPGVCSGTENEKHNPSEGDIVTFKAKVINKGETNPNNFSYQWLVDGVKLKEGEATIPVAGNSVVLSYDWSWKSGDHKVKFVVSGQSGTSESASVNNQLEDYTNALSYRIHVEKSVYDKFNSLASITGTKSFEDWVQHQMKQMDALMSGAGGKEKFRIDEIVIENDGFLPRHSTHAPEDINWDGRWGFETTEWMTDPNRISAQAKQARYDLLHEWGHQVGLIDSYNLNYDGNYIKANLAIPECKNYPGGDVNGTVYEKCLYYKSPAVGGLMSYPDSGKYTAFEVLALNSGKGFRRGYFGEYLFDIPVQNTVKLLNSSGGALASAQLSFYQTQGCNSIPDQVVFSGTTNSEGNYTLPNRSAIKVTTATGHTLRDNPFGTINVVGCNGIFLIKVELNGQTDYQWLDIASFNLAYWAGDTQNAVYTIKSKL